MYNNILMLITVLIAAGGQLLLKHGVVLVGGVRFGDGLWGAITKIVTSPFIMGGFFFYAGSAMLTLVVLSRVDLGIFALFTSLSYVIILVASYYLFGEVLTIEKIFGALLIVSGIFIIIR